MRISAISNYPMNNVYAKTIKPCSVQKTDSECCVQPAFKGKGLGVFISIMGGALGFAIAGPVGAAVGAGIGGTVGGSIDETDNSNHDYDPPEDYPPYPLYNI